MSGLINKINGQHRMSRRRDTVAVAARGIDFGEFDVVAKFFAQAGKAFGSAETITTEAKAEGDTALLGALGGDCEVFGGGAERSLVSFGNPDGQRGLTQHRGQNRLVGHEREDKASGETHADDTCTAIVTAGLGFAAEGFEPGGDGAGLVFGEEGEFFAEAELDGVFGEGAEGEGHVGFAKQEGQVDGESGSGDAIGEGNAVGDHAGELVHEDDGGAVAFVEDGAG